jgi:pectate lyase
MKKILLNLLGVLALLVFGAPQLIPSANAAAFPGAAGFGTGTPGGRGGRVIFVTNLNDSGAGSFRAACEASGPRIIIFRTGGTIRLSDSIRIRNPYVTIAAQTAPGDGISLRGAALIILTHDVVVRGLRIRVGDDPNGPDPGNRDGLMLDNNTGQLYNVVIDHCSISWAIDENLSIWHAGARDITVSHTIVAEALYDSLHPEGPHSMGPLVGEGTSKVTLHSNLFAHNNARNPRVQATEVEVINNIVYNRGQKDVDIGDGTVPQNVCVIGNYFKKGPSFRQNNYPISVRSLRSGSKIYMADNIGSSYTSGNLCDNDSFTTSTRPFASSGVTPKPANQVFDWVLQNVGANPKRHCPVDARIISETRNGGGRIINGVSEVGGWPNLSAGTAPTDSDNDGMPNNWETSCGLNPNDAGDANTDRNNDGYTNVEEYINSLFDSATNASLDPPRLRVISVN